MRAPFWRITAALAVSLVLSTGGIPALGITRPASAATTYTAFTIDSEAGAHVGAGIPQVYTDADSTFATADPYVSSNPGYVFLAITGASGPAVGHWWYVHLAAPIGQNLAVGTYTGATRAAIRAPGEPGIDVYGDGAGCTPAGGEFTVHQIAFSGPTLTAFSASYSFTCDFTPAHIAGEVRYASSQGFSGLRQLPATNLDFGSNLVGEASAAKPAQLVNVGTTPVAISAFGIDGPNAGDFAQSAQTCGSTLAPGASCDWDTIFTPTAVGYRSGVAHFTSDTHGFVHGQPISGFGDVPAPTFPQLQVLPADGKAFGTVTLGASASQAFTVTSIGNVTDAIGARSIIGPDAADFEITGDDCPAQLPVTATCTVTVRFQPGSTGPKTASLSILDAGAYSPYLLPLSGTVVLPPSGVAWGTIRKPGPSYTWTDGVALGRTVRSGSQRLHLAYATDRIGGVWAKNAGPRAGIYYVRSTSGTTWSTPKRINPRTQHATRSALAASGARVYVAWVSQTKIVKYSPTAPRVLYIRVNTKHGDSTAWRSTVRLTSTTGRVDYPTVSASGTDVIVSWTDSVTGSIRAAISHDRGVTWKKVTLGSTTVSGPSGRTGLPSAAVDGSTIAVSWIADATGTVMTRVSSDRGTTWQAAVATGSQANGFVSTAVRGSRVAIAWTTGDDVVVRVRQSGVWGTPYAIGPIDLAGGAFTYAPILVLQDPSRVGVAWSEQQPNDSPYAFLRWAESADNGAHWFATDTIATGPVSRRVNDWASVLWPTASTRIATWNGWTSGTLNYRQYLRIGTGTPVNALAATAWTPERRLGSMTITITDDGRRVLTGTPGH